MSRTRTAGTGADAPATAAARGRQRAQALRRVPLLLALAGLTTQAAVQSTPDPRDIARGRYLVLIGHCNNCHTAGYMAASGQIDEERWLTGNPVGWRGRQGTTFAINLRLYVRDLDVDDWLRAVRTVRSRAPMPWWSLRETTDDDLRAMYAYMRSLMPLGEPAPAFLPAD